MFFSDSTLQKRVETLEEESQSIILKIAKVEEDVAKKTSDYEEQAKNASAQALISLNETDALKNAAKETSEELNKKIAEAKIDVEKAISLSAEITTTSAIVKEKEDEISKTLKALTDRSTFLEQKFNAIETIIEKTAEIEEKVVELEDIFKRGDDNDSKINALFKQIADRKKEIDDIYYRINGYKAKDSTEVDITGLKTELEESYTLIKDKLDKTERELIDFKANTVNAYVGFSEEKEKLFTANLTNWNEKLGGIEKKINELLPHALTAGLSYAYSEKKVDEIKDSKSHSTTFNRAIWGLVLVSLIPFTVSLKSIVDDVSLEIVILRIPKLVLAILPLYIPVLWVAYSSNRKLNLSKRLIEEYSHKEVLSKTFEGLSRQIEDVKDGNISEDLKIKLLYNILEVNSENPGKLISDYNKSDHPLMDALDKSIKLSNAVTKLAKIPGFSKLAASLEKKSQEILKEEGKKAEAGIAGLDENIAKGKTA